MNKRSVKILSVSLSAALLLGIGGTASYALIAKNNEPEGAVVSPEPSAVKAKTDGAVYVLTGADGAVQKTIVPDGKSGGVTYPDAKSKLPVALKISYTLDGKSVTAQELAGKSGRVTLRFDYENEQYETVSVNGAQKKVHVPFAVLTGLVLDNERFSGVTVKNAKLFDDGDRTAIVGMALPDMQATLALDKGTLDIPEYFEISADVKDFKLESTYTVATSSVFSGIDLDNAGSLSGLSDSLTQLTDAMERLTAGSDSLYNGLAALLGGANELAGGINKLSGGLDALVANNEQLTGGSRDVFATLLSAADTQLAAAGLKLPALTIENYDAVLGGVLSSMDAQQPGAKESAARITALKTQLDSFSAFYQGVISYTNGAASAAAGADKLKAAAPQLVSGITTLRDGAQTLSEGLSEFSEQGVKKLTSALGGAEGAADNLRAALEASKQYKPDSGVFGSLDSAKFIYKTEAIEAK